ncbi:MAG: YybH family protein [Woeseiaceae bacterium]
MRSKLVLLLSFLAVIDPAAFAQDAPDRSADESAIRHVTQEYILRRDRGDETGLRALLTANADQRLTSGRMRLGREAIVSGSLESTRNSGGTRVITLNSIRFLGADVAIGNGDYDSLGRADGTDLHMLTTIVFWRIDGEWRIDAIRNARSPDQL